MRKLLFLLLLVPVLCFSQQHMRPSSDVTTFGWSSTPLYSKVNEEITDDDVTVIGNVPGVTNACELGLSAPATTPTSGTATFRVRAKVSVGAGTTEQITCAIYNGSTLVATPVNGQVVSRTVWTTFEGTIDVTTIPSFSDLRVRISAPNVGGTEVVQVTWVELEVPNGIAHRIRIID